MKELSLLCQRILQRRKKLKFSQKKVAQRMDISVAYFQMLERGRRVPGGAMLDCLATALLCSTDWLLGRNPRRWKHRGRNTPIPTIPPLGEHPTILPSEPPQKDQTQSDGL